MGMLEWAEQRLHALTIWDIGVMKLLLLLVGMIAGAFMPLFVRVHLRWFVIIAALLWAFMIYRLLAARSR